VKSKPYIDITLHVLEESGIKLERENDTFYIECGQEFRLKRFDVPADFSSASYLIASGVLAGRVELRGVYDSRQGDKAIVDIVRSMGGNVRWKKEEGVLIAEKSELEGIEVDAGDIPDLVPTIAVLGAVAKGKTVIYNAEHLRYKETDRIETTYRNLKALGIEVEKRRDGLDIRGGNVHGGVVDSYGDHRIAMAFSILGLAADKIIVKNADVVSVSFPDFFEVLKNLGAKVEFV
jgi:3-phosphoshikimate 1-carboxyvinyltransferase